MYFTASLKRYRKQYWHYKVATILIYIIMMLSYEHNEYSYERIKNNLFFS